MNILQKEITFTHDISGRQAANFVHAVTAKPYSIWFIKDDRKINAKSILGILSANIKRNDTVVIEINADDYEEFRFIESIINQ